VQGYCRGATWRRRCEAVRIGGTLRLCTTPCAARSRGARRLGVRVGPAACDRPCSCLLRLGSGSAIATGRFFRRIAGNMPKLTTATATRQRQARRMRGARMQIAARVNIAAPFATGRLARRAFHGRRHRMVQGFRTIDVRSPDISAAHSSFWRCHSIRSRSTGQSTHSPRVRSRPGWPACARGHNSAIRSAISPMATFSPSMTSPRRSWGASTWATRSPSDS
jgi:hypothetical protein